MKSCTSPLVLLQRPEALKVTHCWGNSSTWSELQTEKCGEMKGFELDDHIQKERRKFRVSPKNASGLILSSPGTGGRRGPVDGSLGAKREKDDASLREEYHFHSFCVLPFVHVTFMTCFHVYM